MKKRNILEEGVEALKPDVLIEKKIDANNDFGLMSAADLAAVFGGLETSTIRNWVARREIPFVRVGGQTMFLRDSVREWLQKKEFKPDGSH